MGSDNKYDRLSHRYSRRHSVWWWLWGFFICIHLLISVWLINNHRISWIGLYLSTHIGYSSWKKRTEKWRRMCIDTSLRQRNWTRWVVFIISDVFIEWSYRFFFSDIIFFETQASFTLILCVQVDVCACVRSKPALGILKSLVESHLHSNTWMLKSDWTKKIFKPQTSGSLTAKTGVLPTHDRSTFFTRSLFFHWRAWNGPQILSSLFLDSYVIWLNSLGEAEDDGQAGGHKPEAKRRDGPLSENNWQTLA